MEKKTLSERIEDCGLVIISIAVAALYWWIDTLQLGPMATRLVTTSLFVTYGASAQYFINSAKRMTAEILALSITDHLTGLYNRRGFMTVSEHQLEIKKRNKERLLLLFSDIDDLKSINDGFGHAAGDAAIKDVGEIFKQVFRKSDIIARLGGDEFVVLALGVSAEDSDVVQTRLQQHIDDYNASDTRDYKISISYGIVHMDSDHSLSMKELMVEADALMYEQKENKRS